MILLRSTDVSLRKDYHPNFDLRLASLAAQNKSRMPLEPSSVLRNVQTPYEVNIRRLRRHLWYSRR